MDGVTDAAFRYITDNYGNVDILFTEFTSVEGVGAGATKLLSAFKHHNTSTPTVGQIFGSTPDDFYKTVFVLSEMGFDGVDINMGCPDPHVAKKGGGAGLIQTPKLAQKIISISQKAARDWSDGKKITDVGLNEQIISWVKNYQTASAMKVERKILPISVKTRIGYDKIVTEEWINVLLEMNLANISLHGRTLKQLYSGAADWEEIAKAAQLCKKTKTTLLGNGDIKSLEDAKEKIAKYQTDGALIGRAAFGNPWVFNDHQATLKQKLQTAVEHCEVFESLTPELNFLSLRKHLAWYCRGFGNAGEIRSRLMFANSSGEVREIIKDAKI